MRSVVQLVGALTIGLALVALARYPGQGLIYILFSVVANALLYLGFRRNAIFFDTFIGALLWLGFWLKLSVRVALQGGQFDEPVGRFDGSGAEFDRALLVATTGMAGLLLASLLREKYLFRYSSAAGPQAQPGLAAFYRAHRKSVLTIFALLIVGVAVTNLYFGLYQRGIVPRTVFPYGLNGIYAWLLLFGLASASALILNFEILLGKSAPYAASLLALAETAVSNVSMLSRGMILNAGALGYGLIRRAQLHGGRPPFRYWVVVFLFLAGLFVCSVFAVTHVREYLYQEAVQAQTAGSAKRAYVSIGSLFIDRWVGMEGVAAVSSHPNLGWELWREAWKEVPEAKLGFYDSTFISSPYAHADRARYNFVSLPGAVAFCFYPGSFVFLFVCMFLLGLVAAGVEISVFKLGGGNLILCALLAQVVASRYAHFGYAPAQSYLLLLALYLNLLLIYFSDRILAHWQTRNRG